MDRQLIDKMPLVSVIIPTYNRKTTIGRAIDSVLRQTYQNIEIVVVDDASTDGTERYLHNRFSSEIQRGILVCVANQRNKGAAGARNFGVENAKGAYIAFQDSDDEWEDRFKLEKQMDILLSHHEIHIVYCGVAYYFENEFVDFLPARDLPLEYKEGDLFRRLLTGSVIGPPTVVMRKDSFLQVGGFREECRALEDHEFFIRVARRYRIGFAADTYIKVCGDFGESLSLHVKEVIRTKVYILEKWFDEYMSFGLLTGRLYDILHEAEDYGCREFAVQELKAIKKIADSQQLCRLVDHALEDEQSISNLEKVQGKEDIFVFGDMMRNILPRIKQGKIVWSDIKSDIFDIILFLEEYTKLFQLMQMQERLLRMSGDMENVHSKQEVLDSIQEIISVCDTLSGYLDSCLFVCNVCKSQVFFLQTSPKDIDRNSCPVCKFSDRERLAAAFLDMLRSEDGERLKMLQVGMRSMIRYARRRQDILWCKTLNLPETVFETDALEIDVSDGIYDIIVCSGVPKENKNDMAVLRELHRILKKNGVCVFIDDAYGNGFILRLRNAGFIVNELGKGWFGEEFYQLHGFLDSSVLCVATKGLLL